MIDERKDEEDIQWVHRILQGEVSTFELLVKRYQRGVYYFCLSHVQNPEEAEEATQEVFLRAFRSLSTFSLDKKFKTWLYSIAVNHLRTRWHKGNRILEKMRALFQIEQEKQEKNPESIALNALTEERIRKAVNGLPENLRSVVYLYYFENLPILELAKALGLGEEAIKSRLFRARKLLRKQLEDLEESRDG